MSFVLSRPRDRRAALRRGLLRAGVGALVVLVSWAPAAAAEELEYGWRLKGLGGVIIGLFYPDSGDAVIRTEDGPGASYTTILELTSPDRDGEFYRYGSEIGREGSPVRVWSAYRFRGKAKERQREVHEEDVLDFASAIHAIRRHRPQEPLPIRLWSDGKEYPLVVRPAEVEEIETGGRTWRARRYVIEGRRVEDERYYKGKFQLWVAEDDAATPVRIVGEKGLLTVRLDLADVTREGEAAAFLEDSVTER